MKGKLSLQQRLILPVVLLGLVTLLSNLLAVFSINNVHANAGTIVDKYMVSEGKLEEIRRSMMDIHLLALSHIVAADHATMIRLVQEIKAEEAALDEKLSAYEPLRLPGGRGRLPLPAGQLRRVQTRPGLSGQRQRRQQDPGGLRDSQRRRCPLE